jgi:hypothetical protein
LGKASETKAEGGDELSYEQAKARTLAMMATGFDLGGQDIADRDALHER